MPLVGHGLGILGLEEPPDVLPVLGVVVRAQVEVKPKLEVLEELAPARASGNELTPGGSELAPAAAQQLPELTAAAGRLSRGYARRRKIEVGDFTTVFREGSTAPTSAGADRPSSALAGACSRMRAAEPAGCFSWASSLLL